LTLDLSKLWDHSQPEETERRFREALSTATPEEQLILQTQIARTYGLRKDFERARTLLAEIEPKIQESSAEAQARYHLELGRSYASTTHPPEALTDEAREKARAAYRGAFEIAKSAGLDDLAIDALHMMAIVETSPEDQLAWDLKAIAHMEKSSQPAAKGWEASLRNNVGYALHLQGRYEEALAQFEQALLVRERTGNPKTIRIARWMIAWTLRSLGRFEEALAIQLRLERECDEAGEPDPYVFDELIELYKGMGDEARVAHYTARRAEVK
jgi:tetratricopeptide (TPR) repeat protein